MRRSDVKVGVPYVALDDVKVVVTEIPPTGAFVHLVEADPPLPQPLLHGHHPDADALLASSCCSARTRRSGRSRPSWRRRNW